VPKPKEKVQQKRYLQTAIIAVAIVAVVLGYYSFTLERQSEKILQDRPVTERPAEVIESIPDTPPGYLPEPRLPGLAQAEEPASSFISNAACTNGFITFVFTNILAEEHRLSDFRFYTSGLLHAPECDKQILQPGERTFCSRVNKVAFQKEVQVTMNAPGAKENTVVDCSAAQISGNIIRDVKRLLAQLFG